MLRPLASLAPLPLRLMLGAGFLYHGIGKLPDGLAGFTAMLDGLGVPAAGLVAGLVAAIEIAGGLMLVIGALVPIAATGLIVVMLFAMFLVHAPNGFNFINITGMNEAGPVFGMPGWEVNALYIAGLVSLILSGAGLLSVDVARMREP